MLGSLLALDAAGYLCQQRGYGLNQQAALDRLRQPPLTFVDGATYVAGDHTTIIGANNIAYSTIEQLQHEVDEWLKDTI